MTTRKSTDYKLTAVNYYLVEDKTQDEVCKIFKCSRRSLMRWVERYKKDGNVDIHYRKPVVDFLLQELNKNKTITIEDLLYLLKNKYPDVDLNKSHIVKNMLQSDVIKINHPNTNNNNLASPSIGILENGLNK